MTITKVQLVVIMWLIALAHCYLAIFIDNGALILVIVVLFILSLLLTFAFHDLPSEITLWEKRNKDD